MPNRDGTGPSGKRMGRIARWSSNQNLGCAGKQPNGQLPSIDQTNNKVILSMTLKIIGCSLALIPAIFSAIKKTPLIEDKSQNELIDLRTGEKTGYQIKSKEISEE
jgi:hypothetical protein